MDAAYGGFYNIVPSVREQVDALHGSLSAADSIVINPHKVLFTPLEVTALYSRRKGVLKQTFSLVPEYLRTYDPDEVVDPMDFSLQLGRNFRSLKVWWVIRAFGLSGFRARMEHQLEMAAWLRQQIDADPDFETLDAMTGAARGREGEQRSAAFTPYPLVCFRALPWAWREAEASEYVVRGGTASGGQQKVVLRKAVPRPTLPRSAVVRIAPSTR